MNTIKFHHWNCILTKGKYANGRTALKLIDAVDGEQIAVATVNIPEAELAADEVIIKDYSENTGMYRALKDAGVVGIPLKYVASGFTESPVCKLLI